MSSFKQIYIIKANGDREPFDSQKLLLSLKHSGATDTAAVEVVEHIGKELKDGMSTTHIYRHAFSLLRKIEQQPVAARYSLRRAILELGPTGFPFEDYVAEIFSGLGYETVTGQIIKGKCATHEVDLVAHKKERCIGAEIKFHNSLGIKTDLKVALYVHARFEDIKEKLCSKGNTNGKGEGWLITNTKFTKNAIAYSKCVNLTLVGWNYPHKGNLSDLIQETGVYPITTLSMLTRAEKTALLGVGVILCRDLENNRDMLVQAGVRASKIDTIIEESQALCRVKHRIE